MERFSEVADQMTISTDPRTGKRVVAIMYQKEDQLPFPEF
jgi:hypothetical protein